MVSHSAVPIFVRHVEVLLSKVFFTFAFKNPRPFIALALVPWSALLLLWSLV